MDINENLENAIELNEEELVEVAGGKSAGQKVEATGSANVRQKPNLKGAILGTVSKGTKLNFRGIASYDSRGVAWYKVDFKGQIGWISSKYSKIV
ncbi:MAG: SH3 domain-containing protein [Clostridia bacterium]|nr:SH3 domain-containing protein [Clostridia bacterium]